MINPQILELFTCIAPFRRRVFCLISAMDVACLCIGLDLSLSQKERDVLLNPTPQLFKLSDLSHCAHYVDHSKQLMLIGHDLSKPTVTLLKRDFSIVRHPREISLILWAGWFSTSEASQGPRCRQQLVDTIKARHNWEPLESPNDGQANQVLYLSEIATVVYLVNASCGPKDPQTSLLFLEARLAQEMMDHDETHYCSISEKKISRMRMCSVQKGVLARHRRVREIQHECYFMELTHDVFPVQQPINVCLIAQSGNLRLGTSCKKLVLSFGRCV